MWWGNVQSIVVNVVISYSTYQAVALNAFYLFGLRLKVVYIYKKCCRALLFVLETVEKNKFTIYILGLNDFI